MLNIKTRDTSSDLDQDIKVTILSVEDDKLEQLFLKKQILALGHKLVQARDGAEALKIMKDPSIEIDVILMDRFMPNVDGLTVIKDIRRDPSFSNIPVVMVTSASTPEEMKEGIDAGVFHYLVKPVNENLLKSVLQSAVSEVQKSKALLRELKKHKSSFQMIEYSKFQFKTIEQAKSLAAFVSLCFPHPDRALSGMGELLINAVEHGNLDIGYEQKTHLIEKGLWRREIERRQQHERYKDRVVTVVLKRKEEGVYVVVSDEGTGFDWKPFLSVDPARAGNVNGRGIAKAAHGSFDRLTFNEKGNQVVAFMSSLPKIEW